MFEPIPIAIPPQFWPCRGTFTFSYFRALLEPSSDAIRLVLPAGPRSLCLDLALEGGIYELLLVEKDNPSLESVWFGSIMLASRACVLCEPLPTLTPKQPTV